MRHQIHLQWFKINFGTLVTRSQFQSSFKIFAAILFHWRCLCLNAANLRSCPEVICWSVIAPLRSVQAVFLKRRALKSLILKLKSTCELKFNIRLSAQVLFAKPSWSVPALPATYANEIKIKVLCLFGRVNSEPFCIVYNQLFLAKLFQGFVWVLWEFKMQISRN